MKIYNLQFKIYKKIICYTFFVCAVLIPNLVEASTLGVYVDTGRENVNAIEGELVLPKGVEIENISLGGSSVLMWIEAPVVENGRIRFAGITPGGFVGKHPLFYIESSSDTARTLAEVTFSAVTALRSDGSGESVPVDLSVASRGTLEDSEMPEAFTPVISESQDILEGKKFVAFLAQDKGTGIERYEMSSTWFLSPSDDEWVRASSPSVLTKTELFKKIYIKAVDEAGNYRVEVIHGPYRYATWIIGLIILSCVLLFLNRSFYSRR